jgi:hypothetical protein
VGAEAAGGAPQELAGARVLAELGHGDAAQGERRRVVAQADALESADRIADGEGARGGGDQGVHRNRLMVFAGSGFVTHRPPADLHRLPSTRAVPEFA